MVYPMENETIDLKPLMPLVDIYTQLLSDEERKELYKEARAKINNDEEFLKRLEEKGEDEKSILLSLIGTYAPETKAKEISKLAVEYMQDNKNDLIEIIDKTTKEYNALKAFSYVVKLAITNAKFEIIYQDLDNFEKHLDIAEEYLYKSLDKAEKHLDKFGEHLDELNKTLDDIIKGEY